MDAKGRKVRTLKLAKNVDERLVALCEHLGTNPNAYLIHVIGKSVSRDEMTFKTQQKQETAYSELGQFISAAMTGMKKMNDINDEMKEIANSEKD